MNAGKPDPEKPNQQRGKLWQWIVGTCVATVGAVAALITALTGAGAIHVQVAPVAPPTATVTVTAASAPSATAQVSSSPQSTAGVRWHGDLLITENYADLDLVPVDNHVESGGDVNGNGYLYTPGESLRWTASTDPSKAQCASELRTHAKTNTNYENPTPGMRICLRTDGGRIALLTVKKKLHVRVQRRGDRLERPGRMIRPGR